MPSSRRSAPCSVADHKRCEALLRDSWLRPTNDRCRSHATVKIKGRRLCGKHGSAFALQVALKSGTAVEIPFSPKQYLSPRFMGEDEVTR